jgi:hypothetical protein
VKFLVPLAIEADGAAMARLRDPVVGEPAPLRDGGGEVGMAAAPALIGGDADLEEVGDIGRLRAEDAELAGLGGIAGVIGWGGGVSATAGAISEAARGARPWASRG